MDSYFCKYTNLRNTAGQSACDDEVDDHDDEDLGGNSALKLTTPRLCLKWSQSMVTRNTIRLIHIHIFFGIVHIYMYNTKN